MIEVYKYVNVLSPGIISDIFKLRKNIYNVSICKVSASTQQTYYVRSFFKMELFEKIVNSKF